MFCLHPNALEEATRSGCDKVQASALLIHRVITNMNREPQIHKTRRRSSAECEWLTGPLLVGRVSIQIYDACQACQAHLYLALTSRSNAVRDDLVLLFTRGGGELGNV